MSQEMDFDNIFSNEAFKNIEPARIQALKEVASQIQNKSMNETFDILISFAKNMPDGRELSKAEKLAMFEVIKSYITPQQRGSIEMIMKMMGGF